MLKGVARKHSKQQQHHTPSGCAFLRGKRKRGPKFGPDFGSARASASASSDAKTSHSPRQTNAAKMRPLQQKPDTEVSHTPAARGARKPTRFSFGFPPLEALHRRGPPCSGNVFAAKSGPQSCPGQRAESRIPTARNSATNTSPSPPFPPRLQCCKR